MLLFLLTNYNCYMASEVRKFEGRISAMGKIP